MKKFYMVFGIFILLTYAAATLRGWDFPVAKQQKLSGPDVRSASGGNIFFYSSYRGGK